MVISSEENNNVNGFINGLIEKKIKRFLIGSKRNVKPTKILNNVNNKLR